MENTRYQYSPIIAREPFKLPGNARVALWIVINVEYFDIGSSDFAGAGAFKMDPPNVFDYGARDYGNRVGIWRIMELLDRYGIKGSVALNADLCKHYPIIIEEGKKRGWEYLGHGLSNSVVLGGKTEQEEREIISRTLETIGKSTGEPPAGWLGPALQETFSTPDILAELGVKYLCDWCCDDQPFRMNVRKGTLVSVPYTLDLNDIPAFVYHHQTPEEFCRMVEDQFDTLYREGLRQARVMCIALHPFLIGHAYRIGWLEKALQHIRRHEDVWLTTGREIAAWYYSEYMGMKMI